MQLSPKFFPTFLMILDFYAALVYAFNGDLRRAVYWTSAAVLTGTVTY